MLKLTITQPEFQHPSEKVDFLSLKIPTSLFADLCKFQGAWGVPLETLVLDQLEAFVVDNWDLEKDRPRWRCGMSNSFDLVRELITVKDVAQHYRTEFNRSGKTLCPFHDEKTPSFSLHPGKSFAKCFGCDVSVDALELEYKMGSHANCWEAAKALNERYQLGLNFNGLDKEKAEEMSNVYDLLNKYCKHTHKALLENKDALAWLEKKKGLPLEM